MAKDLILNDLYFNPLVTRTTFFYQILLRLSEILPFGSFWNSTFFVAQNFDPKPKY
jgi:hypothetical protein